MKEILPKGIHRRGKAYVASVNYNCQRRTGSAGTLEDAILLKRDMLDELQGIKVRPLPAAPKASGTTKKALDMAKKISAKTKDQTKLQTRKFKRGKKDKASKDVLAARGFEQRGADEA